MKLFPKLTEKEFEDTWAKIDQNGDGSLQFEELAAYYGFSMSPTCRRSGKPDEDMTDEQILEALQLQAILYDSKKAEEESKREATREADALSEEVKRRASASIISVKMGGPTGENEALRTFLEDCALGDEAAVLAMLERGGNLRVEDDKGQMPLHKLARNGLTRVARSVLERLQLDDPSGASARYDINRPDRSGKTPIFYAAEYGSAEVVRLLLDRGADPNIQNEAGWSALHAAVSGDKIDVVSAFFEHRRVDAKKLCALQDRTGRTALHVASFKAQPEVLQLLLDNGADACASDKAGNDSISLARMTGRKKSKELLELYVEGAK